MIHTLLTLTRPLIIFDTETTGVNPQEDRIIELGFQLWTVEGMQKEWRSLIDPGVPIPAGAVKVHGITLEKIRSTCRACGQEHSAATPECEAFKPPFRFRDLAANIAKGFSGCDFGGKNVRFDLRITKAEMDRAGVQWDYVGARVIDAERLEQIAVPRSLSHLHEKYTGKPHDGAHGAISDVVASHTVIVKQLEVHATLPRDLDELHKLQWPGWLDAEGKFRMANGEPTCFFGKWIGKPMRAIDPGYWDWLLRSDFPEDVQRLARNAKLGKYPEEAK